MAAQRSLSQTNQLSDKALFMDYTYTLMYYMNHTLFYYPINVHASVSNVTLMDFKHLRCVRVCVHVCISLSMTQQVSLEFVCTLDFETIACGIFLRLAVISPLLFFPQLALSLSLSRSPSLQSQLFPSIIHCTSTVPCCSVALPSGITQWSILFLEKCRCLA